MYRSRNSGAHSGNVARQCGLLLASGQDRMANTGADQLSGRHPFNELTKDLTSKRRQRIDTMKRELLSLLKANRFRVSKLRRRTGGRS